MVLLDRLFNTLAIALAGLLAFLFGWRLDEWLTRVELPASRPRLAAWRLRASCFHRPVFAGGAMIQAMAA